MINDFNLGLSLGFILCLVIGMIISLINYIVELSLIERDKRKLMKKNSKKISEMLKKMKKTI